MNQTIKLRCGSWFAVLYVTVFTYVDVLKITHLLILLYLCRFLLNIWCSILIYSAYHLSLFSCVQSLKYLEELKKYTYEDLLRHP